MIEAEFKHSEGILYAKASGILSFDEMRKKFAETLTNNNLPQHLRILEDATTAEVDFPVEKVPEFKHTIEAISSGFTFIKHAVVLDSPKNTAYAYILQNEVVFLNYTLKAFSSLKAAKSWLLLG